MNAPEFLTFLPLVAASLYTLLLIATFGRRGQSGDQIRWFLIFLAASVVWEFLLFFAPDLDIPPSFPLKALLVGTLSLGMTTAVYVKWPQPRQWVLVGAGAILLAVLADLFIPDLTFRVRLFDAAATYRGLTSFLAWFLLSSYILWRTWGDFRQTRFPWHANRLLFWAVGLLFTFAGEAMLYFLWTGPLIAGQAVRFLGVLALAFAMASYRIPDVRTQARWLAVQLAVTAAAALPMLAAVGGVQWLAGRRGWTGNVLYLATLIALAVGFLLYAPGRIVARRLIARTFLAEALDLNQALRRYSQAASRTLEVQQLARVMLGTVGELLDVRRGALLIVSHVDAGTELTAVPGLGEPPPAQVTLPGNSLLLTTLAGQRQPLLQYELDFNPAFARLTPAERAWLQEMAMDVYVPICTGEGLDGIMAVGPRQSGIPHQPDELALMQTLADQSVIALQNARLYSELGAQNQRIRELNLDLLSQNERLEILDRVKSDFIAIASHELRTPLTQVKGYADILAAMNKDNSLTPEQTREIVGHIDRAATQLESLLSAMLDASQIDVAGMHLNYAEESMENVLRQAAEPLQDALRQRRIHYEARGLATLPPVQVDVKRVAQCFTNLLSNAVKYTPDEGRILVFGRQAPVAEGQPPHIEIVVSDSGIGIDRRYHDLIFEKFFRIGDPQLHSTGNTKFKGAGPGLGLPIARGVIEAHHGRIWVESPGENEQLLPGSEFHVLLPLRPPSPRSAGGQTPVAGAADPQPALAAPADRQAA